MLRPGGGSQKAVQSVLTASLVGGYPAVDSCGTLGFGRLNDDLECSGPLGPPSSSPDSFIFKGHLSFVKIMQSQSANILFRNEEAKIKQRRASDKNY